VGQVRPKIDLGPESTGSQQKLLDLRRRLREMVPNTTAFGV